MHYYQTRKSQIKNIDQTWDNGKNKKRKEIKLRVGKGCEKGRIETMEGEWVRSELKPGVMTRACSLS